MAPPRYSSSASAQSSVSMGWPTVAQRPFTRLGIMVRWTVKSKAWGDWFMSTPPPSCFQVPRQGQAR